MRRGRVQGAGPAPLSRLADEWDALRLRAGAHRRALAAARDDTAALRSVCREGMALIADMEALALRACRAFGASGASPRPASARPPNAR